MADTDREGNVYNVFVYGTLKINRGNHRLLSDQEFVGEDFTSEKFLMTESGIPFVFEAPSKYHIKGELYRVHGDAALSQLDCLEGHPEWYQRKQVELQSGETAWLYFMQDESYKSCGTSYISNNEFQEY